MGTPVRTGARTRQDVLLRCPPNTLAATVRRTAYRRVRGLRATHDPAHGCFWHRHRGCKYTTTPATRTEWWQAKFDRNVTRDAAVKKELQGLGWRVIVVWECELKDPETLAQRLDRELRNANRDPIPYPAPHANTAHAAEPPGQYAP